MEDKMRNEPENKNNIQTKSKEESSSYAYLKDASLLPFASFKEVCLRDPRTHRAIEHFDPFFNMTFTLA